MPHSNEYKIVTNKRIAENMYLMGIDSKIISKEGKPGQFIHIKVPGDNSLILRRPISINDIDREASKVYIAYQVVGKGTKILSELKKGDRVDVLGPLGKGFSIDEEIDRVALVGGGCGIAPLKFITRHWDEISYTSFLGYRNRASIYQLDDFRKMSNHTYFTTDDGSAGESGFIIDALTREIAHIDPQLIMACGPIEMLKQVQAISSRYDIPCQISLEERMGCGIGACMVCSCAIQTKDGFEYKKVCSDGPVFWSDEVILDGKHQSSC